MSTLHVGVIGSAGRKEDASKMTKQLYQWMYRDAGYRIVKFFEESDHDELHFHSGGAAWADHLVVSLMKSGIGDAATLHLPTRFHTKYARFSDGNPTGKTANYYHEQFSEKLEQDTLAGLAHFMLDPRVRAIQYKGFFPRNIGIGEASELLLAYTWGPGKQPKPKSGTLHTWRHSTATTKVHVPLGRLAEHYAKQH